MAQGSNRFAIYLLIGRMFTMVASFIMPLVLVRFMSQSDYGVFSQFYTLYTAVYVILALGLHTNLFYFYPTASKEEADKYVSNTTILLLMFGFIGGAIMYIPPLQKAIFGDSELGNHIDFIIAAIMLATPMNIVSPLNTVREDKWGAMLIPGFVAVMRILTVVGCTIVFNDLHQLFKWLLFYQLFILVVVAVYSLRNVRFRLDWTLAKKQMVYSIPFGCAVALQLFSNYFDKFVCIKFLEPAEYAIYSVAFLSIPGITQVYESLCQVNIVNMTRSYKTGHVEEIAPQYQNFVVKTLSFSTPIIFAVAIYAEEIMAFLYTEEYASSAPFFRIYSLTFLTSMLGAGTILRAMGKTKSSFFAFVITCIVGLPSTYWLVSTFGTHGTIVGAFINMILPRLIQMVMESRLLDMNLTKFLPWKQFGKILIPAMIMGIILYAIKLEWHFNIWICIFESIFYVLCLFILYLHSNVFIISKDQLRQIIKK